MSSDEIGYKIADIIDTANERMKSAVDKQIEKLLARIQKLERVADVSPVEHLLHLNATKFSEEMRDGFELQERMLQFRGLPHPHSLTETLSPEGMESEIEGMSHLDHPEDFKHYLDHWCEFATRLDVLIDKLGDEYEDCLSKFSEKHPNWRAVKP